MIDNGQGVDVGEISDRSLVKLLKKLFRSLKLKRNSNGIYLLPSKGVRTLDIVGSTLCSHLKNGDNLYSKTEASDRHEPSQSDQMYKVQPESDDKISNVVEGKHEVPISGRRRCSHLSFEGCLLSDEL